MHLQGIKRATEGNVTLIYVISLAQRAMWRNIWRRLHKATRKVVGKVGKSGEKQVEKREQVGNVL